MGMSPGQRATTSMVEAYLGTAYDNVRKVAEEIEGLIALSQVVDAGTDFTVLAQVITALGDSVSDLASLAQADLVAISDDLVKGNYLGNRKIDIDLALNNTSPDTEVTYQGATLTTNTGAVVQIDFTALDEQGSTVIQELASYTAIYNAIVDGIEAYNAAEPDPQLHVVNTEIDIINSTLPDLPTMIRIRDTDGRASSIDRVQLQVYAGNAVDTNPTWFWAKTTSALQTLANRVGDVIALGNEIDNIIALASKTDEIDYLYADRNKLTGDTDSLFSELNKLQAIHAQLADIAELTARSTEIDYLYANREVLLGATDSIHSELSKLQAIHADLTEIGVVHGLATEISYLYAQAAMLSDIHADRSAIQNVDAVLGEVVTVAGDTAALNTVATHIGDVNTVATNMAAVQAAGGHATTASTKAGEAHDSATAAAGSASTATDQADIATTQAGIATQKSDEIKGVTVGSTTTGAPGTSAVVTYNSTSGQFAFVIPQGEKGDRGEAFNVNSVGLSVDKGLYDAQIKGFSFLATDTATIYFKLSNTSGDWSVGAPFGKGDKGETGDTGNGILSIAWTSTTDPGNAPNLPGATDTYTITYTSGGTDTFTVRHASELSGTDIKSLYEGESNTNAFTDAEKSKLGNIEAEATADQTGAEIKSAYEAEADTNAFTDAEKAKLGGIEAEANNYEHPDKHPASVITQDATHRFVSDVEKTNWNNKLTQDEGDARYALKGQAISASKLYYLTTC